MASLVPWILCAGLLTLYGQSPYFLDTRGMNAYVPPFLSPVDPASPKHLGGEHVHVATSLAADGTFANPFGDTTGPTSWVAPAMPYCLAILLKLFDSSVDATAFGWLVAQSTILGFNWWILYRILCTSGQRYVFLAAIATVIVTDFQWMFQFTHDSVLISLFVTLILYGVSRMGQRPDIPLWQIVSWGALGGLTALASPAIAAGWGACTTFLWKHRLINLTIAASVSILVVAPWTLSNWNEFGTLVPIKINGPFELWQGQVVSRNGLVTLSTEMSHPSRAGTPEGNLYRKLGEQQYIAVKRDQAYDAIFGSFDALTTYVDRCLVRATAASVNFSPSWPAYRNGAFYSLQKSVFPIAFVGFLLSFFLVGRKRHSSAGNYGRVDFFKRTRVKNDVLLACQAVYLVGLLPYVFVSYYHRYSVGLFPVRIVFCFVAIGCVCSFIQHLSQGTKSGNEKTH